MKFEEIINSILSYPNQYEREKGIETAKVECYLKSETWALFLGHKTDNSKTLFYARKGKRSREDSWKWFCVSEDEAELGFPTTVQVYHIINNENNRKRSRN